MWGLVPLSGIMQVCYVLGVGGFSPPGEVGGRLDPRSGLYPVEDDITLKLAHKS